MTKQEKILEELVKLQELSKGDAEVAHGKADDLLLEYINDKQITEAFKKIERWYA